MTSYSSLPLTSPEKYIAQNNLHPSLLSASSTTSSQSTPISQNHIDNLDESQRIPSTCETRHDLSIKPEILLSVNVETNFFPLVPKLIPSSAVCSSLSLTDDTCEAESSTQPVVPVLVKGNCMTSVFQTEISIGYNMIFSKGIWKLTFSFDAPQNSSYGLMFCINPF